MDLRIIGKAQRLFVHFRRDVGKAVGAEIRHQLAFIPHTDHVLTGFDQSAHPAGQADVLILQSDGIADGKIIGGGIFIGKPDAVGTVRIVCLPLHYQKAGYSGIVRYGQRHAVALPLQHIGTDRKIARRLVHTGEVLHCFPLRSRKAAFCHNAVIRIAGLLKKGGGIIADGDPFHIEADKHPDAQGDHHDHGNELRLVQPHCAPQFPE